MTTTTVTPKVCIQCLASYNAGRLIFEWVDATDLDEMLEAQEKVKTRAIAAAKEAGEWPVYFTEPEEFMLADWEGLGNGIVGEYTRLSKVAELAEAIEEHGDAFLAFLEIAEDTEDIGELVDSFQERLVASGCDSEKDYAEQHVAECGWNEIPAGSLKIDTGGYPAIEIDVFDSLGSAIDYDYIARELFMDYDFVRYGGEGYVFGPAR